MRLRAVPVTALVLISLPEAKSLFNDSGGSILIDGTHTFVSIPASIPAYAERLDPHLAAFSIEPDQWPLWAGQGVGKVNQFTYNLLEALGNRTGKGVYIRVGGGLIFPLSSSRPCAFRSFRPSLSGRLLAGRDHMIR